MRRISLATKLTIIMGLLATFITLLSAGGITFLVYRETENQIRREITTTTQQLVTEQFQTENDTFRLQKDDGGAALAQALRENNLSLLIINERGETLARYGIYRNLTTDDMTLFLPQATRDALASRTTGIYQDVTSPIHGRYDTYALPLKSADSSYGYIQTARANNILPLLFASLTNSLLILIPLVWGLTILIAYFAARMAVAPLSTFVSYIESIDTETVHHQIKIPPTLVPEVTTLAQSFNRMLKRIAETVTREREAAEGISHELKTPLTRIGTTLHAILPDVPEPLRTRVRDAASETVQLGRTVETILSLTLARQSPHPTTVWKLKPVIAELIRVATPSTPITVHIPESLQLTESEAHMRILLRNLIENASKYSAPNSTIQINAGSTHSGWWIVIENKLGPKSALKRGYGIGLKLAKSISNQQHWTVSPKAENDVFSVRVTNYNA